MNEQELAKLGISEDDYRTSTFSKHNPFALCVQVASRDNVIAVRDSKDPTKNALVVESHEVVHIRA